MSTNSISVRALLVIAPGKDARFADNTQTLEPDALNNVLGP